MAENHWAPGHDVVDIALAVCIKHIGTLSTIKEYRRSADGAERPNWRVNASGDVFLSGFEELF